MVIVSREHPDIENGIHYPSSDGKPMAETDFHVEAIHLLLDALNDFFADRNDVYVSGNTFWYWREGARTSGDLRTLWWFSASKRRDGDRFAAGMKGALCRRFVLQSLLLARGEEIWDRSIATTKRMESANTLYSIRRVIIWMRHCSGFAVVARSFTQ